MSAQADQKPITYQQILAAPDDSKLNLTYARQEVASGRLEQAAAALERLLLARPNWDSVRLFYGFVLYRLDDMIGAKREFEVLEGRGLSPSQEASRVKYLALATQKGKPLRFSGRLSIGGRYDSNPGRVSDVVAAANVASEDEDYAVSASGSLRVEADLKNGRGDLLFFQANGLMRDYFKVGRADFGATRARIGAKLHGHKVSFSPYVEYGTRHLQGEQLRENAGGGLDVALTLSSQVALLIRGQARYEDYQITSYSTIGSRRDGWRYSANGRLRWRPSDSLILSAGATYRSKDARDGGFSYDAGSFKVSARKLLGMGRYVSVSATASRIEFDRPDNFYSNTITRKDDRLRLRAVAGAPLSTLFPETGLPSQIADIVAQVGATYDNQNSTINRLDIDNFSVDLIFTKRFSF
ncbi:MAG: surface lipoprotein assembly modifier [Rhizobiaceae bacterium]